MVVYDALMITSNSPQISLERLVANEFARELRLRGYTGRGLENALAAALKTFKAKIIPIEQGDDK